jgi:hypothetical protein
LTTPNCANYYGKLRHDRNCAVSPLHWTTYASTVASILTTIGTAFYVYFTHRTTKLAVRQAGVGLALAEQQVEQQRVQLFYRLDSVKKLLTQLPQQTKEQPLPHTGNVVAFIATWRDFLQQLETSVAEGRLPLDVSLAVNEATRTLRDAERIERVYRAESGDIIANDLRSRFVQLTDLRETLKNLCDDHQFRLVGETVSKVD